jgi:lysophospholipase L1-like esterase
MLKKHAIQCATGLALLTGGLCAAAPAGAVTLGAWGDSITFGVGSEATGGYKGPLNQFLDDMPAFDADWAGNLDIWQTIDGEDLGMLAVGGSFADRRNTNANLGSPGSTQYLDSLSLFTGSSGTNPGNGNTIYPMRSLIYAAHRPDRNANNIPDTARWIEGYAGNGLLPDAFLLHIGTNSINTGNQTNPTTGADLRNPSLASAAINTTNDPFANDAATQLSRVLQYIGNELDVLFGTYDTSRSNIYVARILPMDSSASGATDVDRLRNVIRYNYGDRAIDSYQVNYSAGSVVDHLTVTGATSSALDRAGNTLARGGIDDVVAGLSTAVRQRVRIVDFFAIPVQDLIDTVTDYALGISTDLASALTAYSNGQSSRLDNDADGYVDWIGDINEGTVLADTLALSSVTANVDLLGDGLHPTALGYEVMAVRWFEAMAADGFGVVIPEPAGAFAMLGTVLLMRRGRVAKWE